MKKRKYTKRNTKKEIKQETNEVHRCVSLPTSVSGKTLDDRAEKLEVRFNLDFEKNTLDIVDNSGALNIHMPEVNDQNISRVFVLLDMVKEALNNATLANDEWKYVNPENEAIKALKDLANML